MIPWPDNAALARIDSVLGAPAGKRIGVLGLGVVGKAMARHLVSRGAHVIGADQRESLVDDPIAAEISAHSGELRVGEMNETTFADVEAVAISPGAHPDQPAVSAALRRGTPVVGELELCGPLPAKVAAITGTNGKSTTTALLGEMVGAASSTFVGGNLGEPVISWVDRHEKVDVAVLELSSYQLETAYRFRPDVSVVLNVTPDHTERYPDFDAYARTKRRAVDQLADDGVAVLSWDDPQVRAMGENATSRVWWFSTAQSTVPGHGAALRDDHLVPCGDVAPLGEIDLSHRLLLGRHNRENALAAWLAAHALGATEHREALLAAYQRFTGLPHRLETIGEHEGVLYINDSKATNDDAAAIAVRAIQRPTILLLGGRDKGAGYAEVLRAAQANVRLVIALGEARELVAAAVGDSLPLEICETFTGALETAHALSRSGDAVLLAPACSSFDEFPNYVARGEAFRRFVRSLGGES